MIFEVEAVAELLDGGQEPFATIAIAFYFRPAVEIAFYFRPELTCTFYA
jgi:hypothetical protein